MKNDHRFATWLPMLECWLSTHFKGRPCVTFHNPCEYLHVIGKHFAPRHGIDVVTSEYAILQCRSLKAALRICNETPASAPFATVWDGKASVHENT